MNRKQNIRPLKDLNLTSQFLFNEVIGDAQTHRDVLEIIFGKEIPILDENQTEKEFHISPLAHSVRMDVFAMDEEQTVYNTEMQDKRKNDLEKRSRYYQALLDTGLLEPGAPNYNLLNQSYIIFIMTFDLFGFEKYCYTFEPRCKEVPEYVLKDGATRIFLNTKGENADEVSKELVEFLYYVENTTDKVAEASESERIKRIHNRVCKVRVSEEAGMRYLRELEEKNYERQEGREEGIEIGLAQGEVIKLITQIKKKIEKDKPLEIIAEELEEDVNLIKGIYEQVMQNPDKSKIEIYKMLEEKKEE